MDMSADPAEVAQQFPDFPGAAAALTVEVAAGASPRVPAQCRKDVLCNILARTDGQACQAKARRGSAHVLV